MLAAYNRIQPCQTFANKERKLLLLKQAMKLIILYRNFRKERAEEILPGTNALAYSASTTKKKKRPITLTTGRLHRPPRPQQGRVSKVRQEDPDPHRVLALRLGHLLCHHQAGVEFIDILRA